MALSRKLKLGLLTFILFDVLVAVVFFNTLQLRGERQATEALRELGVTVYPETRPLAEFSLIDHHDREFRASDFIGQWNLVFFGFTSCPDICPFTMAELQQFYGALTAAEQAQVRIFMVSVDPERDTPAAMAEYVTGFNEDFVGLTGSPQAIADVAAQFYVAHSQPVPAEHQEHAPVSEEYLIQHSGHLAVVDPRGEFYAVIRSPVRDRDLGLAYQQFLGN